MPISISINETDSVFVDVGMHFECKDCKDIWITMLDELAEIAYYTFIPAGCYEETSSHASYHTLGFWIQGGYLVPVTPKAEAVSKKGNNDGHNRCIFCGALTRSWQGLNLFVRHDVCTKCGR